MSEIDPFRVELKLEFGLLAAIGLSSILTLLFCPSIVKVTMIFKTLSLALYCLVYILELSFLVFEEGDEVSIIDEQVTEAPSVWKNAGS